MADQRWHVNVLLLGITVTVALTACAFDEFEDDAFFEEEDEPVVEEAPDPADDPPPDIQSEPVAYSANFAPGACVQPAPPGLVVECGVLTVPENRFDPDSADIELEVAILRAQAAVQPDPVMYLEGGPGGSALDSFYADPESWTIYEFLDDRDLILLDQRGTGYSFPTLDCPELGDPSFDSAADPEFAATEACRDRLVAEGVDLTAYNSAHSAADVADLRNALGYEQWNLFGISYGTRLALTVMRDHPQGIRSVILDSTYPPNVDAPGEEALHLLAALERLFVACANDAACNADYPDLEDIFLGTVTELQFEPALAELYDPFEDEFYDEEINGDLFADAVLNALNDQFLIPMLPRVIYEVSEGNFDTFSILVEGGGFARAPRRQAEDVSDSEGMNYSVQCNEEYAFGDYADAEARALAEIPDALLGSTLDPTAFNFDVCDFWGAGRADPVENESVASDVPTLILAGQFDPVTPPVWGQIAAQTLSNSIYFEFPGYGHSVSTGEDCILDIMTQFVRDPSSVPDASCMDGITLRFVGPDEPLDF